MNILITSDAHDNWENMKKAVRIAEEQRCEHILFAGDFICPVGLDCFVDFAGHVHMVWGNNEGEKLGFTTSIAAVKNITHYGDVMDTTIDGVRIYMNHYPGIVENAALSGKYDIAIFGHTHEYHEERGANGTLLVNPGEIEGHRTGTASVMLFDTTTRTIKRIDV